MRRCPSLAVAALLLCTACSTTKAASEPTPEPSIDQSSVVKAAVVATSKGPARINQKIEITGGGTGGTITVTGSIDFAGDKATLAVDLPQGGISHVDEVFAGKQAYVRGASGVDGDTWAVTARDTAEAHYVLRAPLNDPGHVLRQISAMHHVSREGDETVAGVRTVHYRGKLDHETLTLRMAQETREKLTQLRDILGGELPAYADAWVDQQGRVVQTRMSLDFSAGRVSVTTGLSELGKPIQVSVPAAADTAAATGFTGILTG